MNLSDVAKCLRGAEQVTLTLARREDGVRVLIQPRLTDEPSGLDDAAKALRAALSAPLIFTAGDDQLDDSLAEALDGYVQARSVGFAELDAAAERIKTATTKSANQAKKSKKATTAASKSKASDGAGAEPAKKEAPKSDTISLFADEDGA